MPKQKKQQSSFKKFINWFKPTSFKKGAMLFALAFVVIGGGYMAYSSLAATTQLAAFPQAPSGKYKVKCFGNCIYDWDAHAKEPTTVAKIRGTGDYVNVKNDDSYGFYFGEPWVSAPSGYTSTRACANVRATLNAEPASMRISMSFNDFGGSATQDFVKTEKVDNRIPSQDTFVTKCTNATLVPRGAHFAFVRVTKLGGSTVYVKNITIKTD